jgi:hypothetical protein
MVLVIIFDLLILSFLSLILCVFVIVDVIIVGFIIMVIAVFVSDFTTAPVTTIISDVAIGLAATVVL